MEIYYQGKNITNLVQTRSCIARDTCGSRCDSLDIEFENAAGWYSWGPQEDDQIVVTHNGYDTGIMYVNMVMPEEGRYRIFATSLPCTARNKANRSFIDKTIEEIIRSCAMVSGMDFKIVGINPEERIPYIERDNEGCGAFLSRFLSLEGAVLKCINGKYTAIGIEYAQNLPAMQTVSLYSKQEGATYRRTGMAKSSITIKTPYASATATDISVPGNRPGIVISGIYPAKTDIQAGRWARAKLLEMNRQCECVRIENGFNASLTAMMRMDIEGDTAAAGEWLVENVEHDFINLKTTASLHRCVRSIQ